MDPSLRLKIAPQRRLAMTFALRQALEILQMPQIELAQWLSQEIEKNPLLEEIPSSKKNYSQEEIASPVSLYDHLKLQIRESFPLTAEQAIAEEFLEHLDEKGYLCTSLEEISLLAQKPLPHIELILATLHTFDPPGIFARSLQESLLLQLKAQGDLQSSAFYLIRDCFDDLIHGRYSSIKKKIGSVDLSKAIQKLARLHFRPGAAYQCETAPLAIPDLRIAQTEKGWTIEVGEDELPKFQIHSAYESISPESPEEKESLRAWSTAGKWLFRSLKRRRKILTEIGIFLIRMQAPYLSMKGNLRSMSLQDLAANLQLHESTLSRALSGKYAETPRGLIPLRSLFTAFATTDHAKKALQQLISQENKTRPLTDDELSSHLKKEGHPIARRTIAKYRRDLKIGSASARKNIQ